MKTKRKPIQIAGINNDLYVLCDDGSIWYMGANNDWIKMIQIPNTDNDIVELNKNANNTRSTE